MLNKYIRITKFHFKSIEEIFIGYSITNKTYRVYISSSRIIIETVHVKFHENTDKVIEKCIDITNIEVPEMVMTKHNRD
jgi:hypothetical protein